MNNIYKDLYQFSSYAEPIDLTFHQYLIPGEGPMLVHTGNVQHAQALMPDLKALLGGKPLKYIFVSHFEADECGGLPLILQHFPEARAISSEVTARQLTGFGITNDVVIKKAGDRLTASDAEFEFISYPSEMHLWEGLLLLDKRRKVLFSSDLMLRFGKAEGQVIEGSLQEEVANIRHEQIPDVEKRRGLQELLGRLDIEFIATGHGPCIKIVR